VSYLKDSAQLLGNPIKILGEAVKESEFEKTFCSIKGIKDEYKDEQTAVYNNVAVNFELRLNVRTATTIKG
jgi:hypothetical protein